MSLNELIKALNKGRDFQVIAANDPDSPFMVDEWISTGALALDAITGKGLPIGRIVELYGDTSTGKTLVAQQAITSAQQTGAIVVYIDTERAASLDMMQTLGIDVENLIYTDPDTIEEVFQLMQDVLEAKDPGQSALIVWDSVAATTVAIEKEGDYGKATVGRHALMMSQGLRKFNRLLSKNNACALFVNQTRQKIGVMFGDDETTFGGKALPFYSSIRIRLKKSGKIEEKDGKKKRVVGVNTIATVVKNKLAKPFLTAKLPIYFDSGIDDAEATMLYLKDTGDIVVKGSWHYITLAGEEYKWQGIWYDLFDTHYDMIKDLMEGSVI